LLGKSIQQEEEIKKILKIFAEHNDKLGELINIDYSKSTITKYNTTLKHLRSFILFKYKKTDLEVTKINNLFVTDFEIYLKKQKDCSLNTTMKYINPIANMPELTKAKNVKEIKGDFGYL